MEISPVEVDPCRVVMSRCLVRGRVVQVMGTLGLSVVLDYKVRDYFIPFELASTRAVFGRKLV